MLRELIQLFQKRQLLSLQEISIHFNMDESATEGMIQILQKRHLIQPLSEVCQGCHQSCRDCDYAGKTKLYRWNDNKSE